MIRRQQQKDKSLFNISTCKTHSLELRRKEMVGKVNQCDIWGVLLVLQRQRVFIQLKIQNSMNTLQSILLFNTWKNTHWKDWQPCLLLIISLLCILIGCNIFQLLPRTPQKAICILACCAIVKQMNHGFTICAAPHRQSCEMSITLYTLQNLQIKFHSFHLLCKSYEKKASFLEIVFSLKLFPPTCQYLTLIYPLGKG